MPTSAGLSGWRGPLSAEKGTPVIIEVGELGCHLERGRFHLGESGELEGRFQGGWLAQLEARTFVEGSCRWIQRHRNVPEGPDDLHAIGVVPDIGSDGAAAGSDPLHLR